MSIDQWHSTMHDQLDDFLNLPLPVPEIARRLDASYETPLLPIPPGYAVEWEDDVPWLYPKRGLIARFLRWWWRDGELH